MLKVQGGLLERCPNCQSTKGLYTKVTIYGLRRIHHFDRSIEEDKRWMHESKAISLYCLECNRLVAKKVEDEI